MIIYESGFSATYEPYTAKNLIVAGMGMIKKGIDKLAQFASVYSGICIVTTAIAVVGGVTVSPLISIPVALLVFGICIAYQHYRPDPIQKLQSEVSELKAKLARLEKQD
jgi:hypothetical protein